METQIIYATPILEAANSSGRKKFWQGFVATIGDTPEVAHWTTSWQETASGGLSKKNRSEFTHVESKNVGRSNETAPKDQGISEMEAIMNKKIDSGYHEAGEVSTVLPLPMLAHKFKDRSSALRYPCFVQPKLDGARMLFDGTKGWSRQGKLYIPECIAHLQFDTQGMILDGECMLPPGYTFQQTISAIKKFDPALSPLLQYYVFDIVSIGTNAHFEDRLEELDLLIGLGRDESNVPEQVHFVSTILCDDEAEVAGWLAKSLKKGYEGLILRNCKGQYAAGQRSADLQKLKEFIDAEFKITDCVDGRGREAEAIMYVCETAEGNEFSVRPTGKVDDRKTLWYEFCAGTNDPRGKMLTVKFQEYSDAGIPRFPVGVSIRDYEG